MMDFDNLNNSYFEDGTSPVEVYSVTFFVPLCSLLIAVTSFILNLSIITVTTIETISLNLVLLLALTSFCNHLTAFFVSLGIPLLTSIIYIYRQVTEDKLKFLKKSILQYQPSEDFNRRFIGDYRGHLLLATAISILAVDFAFFPVRFSKTETYGWSVMDAGVGSFVLVHGLCSSSARKSNVVQSSFKKCILSSFPLFMLGIIRLATTTAVGYHKVVPEYGIHWNFFFTLALTKVICYFISSCLAFIQSGILAVIILILHQILLSKKLTAFILSESRENFIEANKEGICSLLGFVSIYFCGVQMGQYLWTKREKISEYIYMLFILTVTGVCGWILMYIIDINIQPVSRRMANLAYGIWVVSLTSLQIALHLAHQIMSFFLSKILQKDFSDCFLWKTINYNGLLYFLTANILTGLVNLSIKTENCEEWLSFLILVIYLTVLTTSVIIPYTKSVQLKFW